MSDEKQHLKNAVLRNLPVTGGIDATIVVRCVLENAASVSSLLIVSGAVIAEAMTGKNSDG
ncbi:MAG: hypothetical protein R3C49_13860 [Planctomycetaceae bacterium]